MNLTPNPSAISFNSSKSSGNSITWNLDKNLIPKSCLFPENKPLFGFCVAIKVKSGWALISCKGFPDISILKILLSNDSSIHWRTSLDAKFISSNNNGYPSLNASIKGPSTLLIPAKEFWSPIYEPNKSCVLVSWLKLNLFNVLFFLSSIGFNFSSSSRIEQIISTDKVFDN